MSVFKLDCRITIGDRVVDFCNDVEVVQSYKELGATCRIKLPRRLWVGKQPITGWLEAGMPVVVQYGYDGALRTEFEGYVSSFKPGIPLEILCEDEFYWLRQRGVTMPKIGSSTVGYILRKIFDACALDYVEIVPGSPVLNFSVQGFQAVGESGLELVERLKERYGLNGFFVGKTKFYADGPNLGEDNGIPAIDPYADRPTHIYEIGTNVISQDLTVVKKETVKIKVTVVGKVGGTTMSASAGDEGGLTIKVVLPGFYDKLLLEKIAVQKLAQYRYDGLQGKLTGFNMPLAEVGDWALVRDPQRLFGGDYDGTYSIVAVRKSFGVNGSRREVELGVKRG